MFYQFNNDVFDNVFEMIAVAVAVVVVVVAAVVLVVVVQKMGLHLY